MLVNEKELFALNHGLNSLLNLVAISSTVQKLEQTEEGLNGYLTKVYNREIEFDIVRDDDGLPVLGDDGEYTYVEVEVVSQEEQGRDKLKKILESLNITKLSQLIDLFNKDTKSSVESVEQMHDLVLEIRQKLEPVVQLGRVYENLGKLNARDETLVDIKNIYEKEMEALKKFLIIEGEL